MAGGAAPWPQEDITMATEEAADEQDFHIPTVPELTCVIFYK
jgi:hypothetical protein